MGAGQEGRRGFTRDFDVNGSGQRRCARRTGKTEMRTRLEMQDDAGVEGAEDVVKENRDERGKLTIVVLLVREVEGFRKERDKGTGRATVPDNELLTGKAICRRVEEMERGSREGRKARKEKSEEPRLLLLAQAVQLRPFRRDIPAAQISPSCQAQYPESGGPELAKEKSTSGEFCIFPSS